MLRENIMPIISDELKRFHLRVVKSNLESVKFIGDAWRVAYTHCKRTGSKWQLQTFQDEEVTIFFPRAGDESA